jgi:hypothetical protein
MKKVIIAAILLTGCFHRSFAQDEAKKEKTMDMYVGVQLNGLIRQVFNFNNSNTNTNTNPYLLIYSINSRKTGWGLRLGAGYNYNSFKNNDGIVETETKINDMQIRLGVEKLFRLANKWSAGAGLDIVYNNNDDHTISTVNSSTVPQTTDTKTILTSYGGGPQAWLRYHITDKVLIGTEASFYYVTGKETRSITITKGFPGPFNNPPDETDDVNRGTFNSPIVFFLIVKI